MSMTLILWKTPVVDDPDEAKALLAPYVESEDESSFAPSTDLTLLTDALFGLYPYDESDESPWSDPPMLSDRIVALDIRWGADNAVLDTILQLAREHELVLFDPQGPDIHCPPWAADDSEHGPRAPTPGEYVRTLALGAVGVLLVVGGWVASIPVLSWLLIAVGGFVAILAVLFLAVAIRYSLFGAPAD